MNFWFRFIYKYRSVVEIGNLTYLKEIDIVAVNDLEKSIIFAEIKREKENISIAGLKDKARNLEAQLKDYHAEFIGLSIEDM
ncbi:hypothetical protein [Pedobacter nutrimenti]|uniref:hypothetical protein n=1 Tax=Pedobacter nutrimenti TaxID=1241337 RepID=UPI002930F952|nr:hypothetical protein [Pedobacter nutrimenti]